MIPNGLKFLKSFLVCINLCIIACYLLVCISPYVDTGNYWYIALPGLVFPQIVAGLIIFILIWALAKSKWCWISIVTLLLGVQQIMVAFGFNVPKKFESHKSENALRVLQWNVSDWDEYNKERKGGTSFRPLMLDLVKEQDADILCFEEFFEPKHNNGYFEQNISPFVTMGYAYHFFIPSQVYANYYQSGIAIFSKYPIIDSVNFSFNENSRGEHLIYTDIKVKGKIFRIFATHLQSVHFDQADYKSLSRLKRVRERNLNDSRNIISKLKKAYKSRYKQAELVSEKIRESPYPSLICGDFNDVPNSGTYFKIRGDLQDAFLEKGMLLGRTFRFISPTLRIDYILADKKFSVTQYQRIKVPYSDHYPVEADLRY